MPTLLLGPLLGFEHGNCYTVCVVTGPALALPLVLHLSTGMTIAFAPAGTTSSGQFWRAEALLPPSPAGAQTITYSITASGGAVFDQQGRGAWSFYVPAAGERARLAYASGNGFSSPALAAATPQPFALWDRLAAEHERAPFSLLLMGGDQLYADAVRHLDAVREVTELPPARMKSFVPPPDLVARLDVFYDALYRERWSEPATASLLAAVPTVMMWDDHDIVDSRGSHDDVPRDTPLYRAIYRAARKYFLLYQLRTVANRSLLAPAQVEPMSGHCALGFEFADVRCLVLDHRSDRTVTEVMSEAQHDAVQAWLAAVPGADQEPIQRPVLVLSALPLVYHSFTRIGTSREFTPWTEPATDGGGDHRTVPEHRGERTRLIKNLFACPAPVWVLSGDVQVGALGAIHDGAGCRTIFQVVSSGIVHPPPAALTWAGLQYLTTDRPEKIVGTALSTEMLTPDHGPRYLRDRNFATLERTAKGKLWVRWICEHPGKLLPPQILA